MNDFINSLLAYLMIVGAVFGFLTICNWDFNPMDWNGFSRVVLAIFVVFGLRVFIDD